MQGYLNYYHQTHAMKNSFSPIYLPLELASLQVYPPALARSVYLTSLYDPEINLSSIKSFTSAWKFYVGYS